MDERIITITSTAPLTQQQSEIILCVAMALSGVRMDLDVQDITDIVVELHNDGRTWDSVGLAILGASKGQGIH